MIDSDRGSGSRVSAMQWQCRSISRYHYQFEIASDLHMLIKQE